MIQRRQQARLALETHHTFAIVSEWFGEKFYGYGAPQLRIDSLVYITHAARAQVMRDFVMCNLLPIIVCRNRCRYVIRCERNEPLFTAIERASRRPERPLCMGETGWGKAHRVMDGRVEGIILTESEATWIRNCRLAAKGD